MNKSTEIDTIRVEDILYAISYLQASEAGLLGERKLTPYEAGISGSLTADLSDIYEKYERGEITREEVKKFVIKKTITALIAKVFDFIEKVVIQKIVDKIKERLPLLSPIIDIVRSRVRELIKQKLPEVVDKAYNFLKNKLRKIFA